jgi:peptidoglycan LD-endopeptidase CwlK
MNLKDKLEGVIPEMRQKVERVLAAMSALGHPMFVVSGNRTVEEQQKLFAQGRTKPGPIVTNADGVEKKSNHQGGKAVDCAFAGGDPWSSSHPWEAYGACAKAVGLKWGGDFKSLVDKPHIELP